MEVDRQGGVAGVEGFRAALLDWYDREGRELPWRARPGEAVPDAYSVWLSEVMLQQTTVAHGTPYWEQFMEAFPTVCALASADVDTVMGMWAGLGYYARARNLHACASRVCHEMDGVFPTDEVTLLSLPGIGPYTAAAIAAICGGHATNVVDGNVERVVSRLFAVEAPLPKARPELKRLAGTLVRKERARDYPQTMMDLGATVCRPKSPKCGSCPVREWCRACAEGEPESYPRKAKKVAVPTRYGNAFVLQRGEEVWLQRRPSRALLGGTLGFPTSEWGAVPEAGAGAPCDAEWREAGAATHMFSHFRLELCVFAGQRCEPKHDPGGEGAWHPFSAVEKLPTAMRKVWTRAQASAL